MGSPGYSPRRRYATMRDVPCCVHGVLHRTATLLTAALLVALLAAPGTAAQETAGCAAWPPEALSAPAPPIPPRVEGPNGVVALTFDAGSDRGYTADILDFALTEHIPISFGVTGRWAQANPDLVQRMAAEGHLVINHGLTHRSFTGLSDKLGGLSPERRRAELADADAVLAPLVGHTTCPWYRLPYGDADRRIVSDVTPLGYGQPVGWTVDSYGWRGASVSAILERCLRLAQPDAVYVLHTGAASLDGPAFPTLVESLRAAGYGFSTVALLSPPAR